MDQTPTPTRFIRNCEEVGLFEDLKHVNIFDETFRRAVEDPGSDPSRVRRMISIQNEDTLHTPQILAHLVDGTEPAAEAASTTTANYFAGIGKKTESPDPKPKASPKPAKSSVRKRPRLRPNGLDKLVPPKEPTAECPIIPVAFPDAIQIQPKWTVVLQYPSYEKDPTVKEKLKTLLVKNESSSQQTISLGQPNVPPPATAVLFKPMSQPKVPLSLNPLEGESSVPPIKPKTPTILERNNEAAKRYRNRKNVYLNNLKLRNEQLEDENRRLRRQNEELLAKLRQMMDTGKVLQCG